jgi:hypothetical protein
MIRESSASRKLSRLALLLSFVFVLRTGISSAQVSFKGDFLGGQASGTFDTWGLATGDFNGDGKLDIASVSLNENTLNVFLGNGDGTFTGGFTYTFTGEPNSPISVIAADVNGDGNLDLIVVCYNTLNVTGGGTVSVFFGNGDGTFQHNADYILKNHPTAVVAADFNGDGALDLAATVNDAGTVAILLNNGSGTFQAPVSYGASNGPMSIAVGDFNSDGNPDLVVTNYCVLPATSTFCGNGASYYGTVSVLLGKGDGTFGAAVSYPAGVAPFAITAAALSSGGNLDLLVTDNSQGSLLVLLGKGDGTFQSPVSYPADSASGDGAYPTVADFNGDGKLDVVTSGLSVVEFLGNGDGTLQQAVDYYRSSAGYPYFYLVGGDFNGDGSPDIAVGFNFVFSVFLNAAGTTRQATTTTVQTTYNGCGSATVTASVASSGQVPTGTLTLQLDGQYYTPSQFGSLNSSGSASDNLSSLSVGSHTIKVVYSGDSLTQGSTGSSSLNVQPLASTTVLTSSPNPSTVGQTVEFTATVTSSSENCVSGNVTFLDGTTVLGTSPVSQGISQASASFSTATLTAGNHSIKAEYAGATYVAPSVSNILVQVVNSPANASLSPSSLSFPSTPVGQSSAVQTVTLSNTGTLSLTVIGISASANFSETNNCGTSVAGGQSCTISVTFTPMQGGSISGAITVNDNAGQQQVPLTGTGQGPAATLSPASLTFVNQAVGTTSSPQTVTVTNSGNTTLTITSIKITGAGSGNFAQTNNCGTLSAGSACTIKATFTPTSANTFTASISIYDNLPGSPQSVLLTGSTQSAPLVSLSPMSISFPNQYVGTSGLPQSATLTNSGSAPLTITNVTASPSDFGLVNTCGSSVAAGNECTISVFFDPTTSGTRNGTLTVTDNASNSPQTVTLTGQGEDFSLANSSSATATVSPGQTATYNVTISPQGGFSQMVALSCSGAPAPSTCSVSPSSMKLSGTSSSKATVTVTTVGSAMGMTQPIGIPPAGRTLDWSTELSGTFGLAILATWLGFGREIRRRMVPYGYVFLLLLCGISMPACGGGNNGNSGGGQTPAGSYALTVTGTFTSGSATLTHTTKLTLIVQ